MKLTKKYLNDHNIMNPYNLCQKADSKIYIDYIPADNGRLTARYAYWKFYRLDFVRPENKSKEGSKEFTVAHREVKESVLQTAIQWVKDVYNIEITDKDPFGSWHPKGTLEKLAKILEGK